MLRADRFSLSRAAGSCRFVPKTEGVGILAGNPIQSTHRVDGVSPAECLGDVHRRPGPQRHWIAGWNLDCVAIAGQFDRSHVLHNTHPNPWRGREKHEKVTGFKRMTT